MNVSGITSITSTAELKTTSFSGAGTYVNGTFSKKWEVDCGGLATQKDEVASGDLTITSSSSTTIANANTPVKLAGTTAATNLFRVTSPQSNRLTYDGSRTRKFKATASISFVSSNNNQEISFYIAKNGTAITATRSRRKIGTGSDIGFIGIAGIVELAAGDYVEVFVENNSSATAVTALYMNFSIQ